MAVYAYARVSTVEQGNGTSPESQLKTAEGCAMMRGLSAPVLFQDIGVSGSVPLALRPGGAAMLAELHEGDTVIAAKLDRLFRSARDALETVEDFARCRVALIMCDMGAEPVTGNGIGKMFLTVLAALAEFERDRIAERMRSGRAVKASRGGFIGGKEPPYGFSVEGQGRGAMLVENEGEQLVIAWVKRLRGQGNNIPAIIGGLTARGFISRSGKPFRVQQIIRMIDDYRPRPRNQIKERIRRVPLVQEGA